MKNILKNILKKILKSLGYQINRDDFNNILLHPREFLPIEDNDDNFQLYKRAIKKSKSEWNDNFFKQMSYFSLIQLIRFTLKKNEVYDFVECGCWQGHSSYITAQLIQEYHKEINLHIFDSFDSLDSLSKLHKLDGKLIDEKIKNRIHSIWQTDENFVKNEVLKDFNFCSTYKGLIPSRFEELGSKKFSFVHIDLVFYEPTFSSIQFFFPRLVKGGVIFCDYNSSNFRGATNAWNKYFEDKNYTFFFQNPLKGCFIIK